MEEEGRGGRRIKGKMDAEEGMKRSGGMGKKGGGKGDRAMEIEGRREMGKGRRRKY